jgi:hypothetical protein
MNVVNLNKLASEITVSEGLKKSVNIGQVKEVMKLLFKKLNKMTIEDINGIIKRYNTKK